MGYLPLLRDFSRLTCMYRLPGALVHGSRPFIAPSVQRLSGNASAAASGDDVSDMAMSKGLKTVEDMPGGRSQLHVLLSLSLARGGLNKNIFKVHMDAVKRNGKIMKASGSKGRTVYLADPEEVAKVYRNEPKHPHRPQGFSLRFMQKEYENVKTGVFFSNGLDWYIHKRNLSKRMLKPPEVAKYIPRLTAITVDAVSRLESLRFPAGHRQEYEVRDVDNELFKWAFESISDVLFDKRLGTLEENPRPEALEFINAVGQFLRNFVESSLIPAFVYKYYRPRRYKQMVTSYGILSSFAEKLIKEQLQESLNDGDSDTQKLIPFLLSTGEITEKNIISSINETYFAGVDTTSNTSQWALYLLAKHRDAQEKLRSEVKKAFEEYSDIDQHVLEKMPYLRAVIKETLRLYPVALVTSRKIASDMVIGEYFVPKGTEVNSLHWPMSHCEDYFPEPYSFKPERWLRTENKEELPLFASIPFGHGLRMCLGRRLATLEISLLLSHILRIFRLEYPDGKRVEPYFRGITIPDRPIRVKFIRD